MLVQFDGTTYTFNFIQLNSAYYGTFDSTDASAVGMLTAESLDGIFWYRIPDCDISDSDNLSFAMMSYHWPLLRLSGGMVTPETSVNGAEDITISEDFVRSIIRDIVGINCIFSNLEEMKQGVTNLDSQFDTSIKNIIDTVGGTFSSPKSITDVSPASHLWTALIASDTGFIDQTVSKRNVYDTMYSDVAFYFYGNDGVHGNGYYYPLYLSQVVGSQSINLPTPQSLYITGNNKGVPFVETPGLVDYIEYVNPFLPVSFLPNDIVKLRLNYKHSETTIFNKTIHPRSYMLHLKLY